MNPAKNQRVRWVLAAMLLAAFLCVQGGLTAHVHSGDHDVIDCLQCKTDSNSVALPAASGQSALFSSQFNTPSDTLPSAVSTHYSLSARGPPQLSC